MRNWKFINTPITIKNQSFEPTYEELKVKEKSFIWDIIIFVWAYLWGIESICEEHKAL